MDNNGFDIIRELPEELQQQVLKFAFSHPCADMIKNAKVDSIADVATFAVQRWTHVPGYGWLHGESLMSPSMYTEGFWKLNLFLE